MKPMPQAARPLLPDHARTTASCRSLDFVHGNFIDDREQVSDIDDAQALVPRNRQPAMLAEQNLGTERNTADVAPEIAGLLVFVILFLVDLELDLRHGPRDLDDLAEQRVTRVLLRT